MKRCLLFQLDGDSDNLLYISRVDDNFQRPTDTINGYFYLGNIINYSLVDDVKDYIIQSDSHWKHETFTFNKDKGDRWFKLLNK